MFTLRPIHTSDTELYSFMEQLLTGAFPTEEYRDLSDLRRNTDTLPQFINGVLTDGPTPVGICSYWPFERFTYVEHLATLPEVRGRGYGKQALDLLKQLRPLPIVLEAELPLTALASRRLHYYIRNGFTLWGDDYCQPPYRAGHDYLPMCLLVYAPWQPHDLTRAQAVRTIYNEVYGVDGIEGIVSRS